MLVVLATENLNVVEMSHESKGWERGRARLLSFRKRNSIRRGTQFSIRAEARGKLVVEPIGLEPTTSCMPCKRAISVSN